MKIKVSNVNTPNWKEVTVKSRIPEELEKLSEIARNIWWAWNFEATELFRDLDPELWKECGQNPVLLLERMSYEKLEALAKDKVILRRMNEVYTKFRDYMDVKPDEQRPSIAYFSMEYGLSSVLKIYSGGLGVLAGDYLKEASDSNVDLCAVGFLYRYGYFTQTLSMDGQSLGEITVTVQETYGTQVYVAVGSLFQIVAGKYAQTTGIYLKYMIQTVFHTEICNGRTIAVGFYIHVIAELGIYIFHSAQNNLIFSKRLKLGIAHTFQQQNRVLSYFFPKSRVKVSKQFGGFKVP